jgi:hypothetical protein
MQKLQLYIEGQRLDLFKDEIVSLTETIQNIKDVSKIFTSFTKTFSLPASKVNNKIFKHYYNFDIVGGFDARIKKDGKIELNTIPYKVGRIKLEGVELKNNVAHTYNITFFGNTVELPDVLGEDKLSSLLFSNSGYSIPYTAANIKSYMGAIGDSKIIVPLITHTDRIYYNSGEIVAGTDNVSFNNGVVKGLKWDQLKFAIRLYELILEIEAKYTIAEGYSSNIVFSRDFFNTSNPVFYNLYMWLHRKSGAVEPAQQVTFLTSQVDGFNSSTSIIISTGANFATPSYLFVSPNRITSHSLYFTPTTGEAYIVSVTLNGLPYWQSTSASGSRTFTDEFSLVGSGQYNIFVTAETGIVFSSVIWEFDGDFQNNPYQETFTTTSFSITNDFDFLVKEQIPDITIMSFLTGLFKMFNLVAYADENNTIVVRPLEATDVSKFSTEDNLSYYTNSDINGNDTPINYNISSFIDTTKSKVNVALPYNEIVYGYEGTGSFLAKQHNQLAGSNWGALSYSGDPQGQTGGVNYNASTEIYKVLVPFEHFKYERLINVTGSVDTTIQWGYSVNENQQPYIGKPLIFYAIQRSAGMTAISLITSASSVTQVTNYTIPSNSLYLDSVTGKQNINFNNEINEYTRTTEFSDTLFSTYHSPYIIDVFNSSRRITKITSYLPLRILFDFKLNDTFEINAQKYIINSVTTNLQSGKSEMELLNKV